MKPCHIFAAIVAAFLFDVQAWTTTVIKMDLFYRNHTISKSMLYFLLDETNKYRLDKNY